MSWFEAVEFANRLSELAGRVPAFEVKKGGRLGFEFGEPEVAFLGLEATGFRLATEAEWEVAARAGTESAIYAGRLTMPDGPELAPLAWYRGNSDGRTHPTGLKKENPWGLHDMLGNVWEWVLDWYGSYPGELVADPLGPLGPTESVGRVVRGGSWNSEAKQVRAAARFAIKPGEYSEERGFRLARRQRSSRP